MVAWRIPCNVGLLWWRENSWRWYRCRERQRWVALAALKEHRKYLRIFAVWLFVGMGSVYLMQVSSTIAWYEHARLVFFGGNR